MPTYVETPRYACALGGAIGAVNALPRTVPILHASLGCGGNLNAALGPAAGHAGSSYMGGLASPCSGVQENEIVFGGERRLSEQIEATLDIVDADLYVVLTGCMTEMVGDDVDAVVGTYRAKGVPIVPVATGGFKGNSLVGYDLVLRALFRHYVEQGVPKQPGSVNLWGIPPGLDVFWEGNLIELRRLLDALGLKVNAIYTPNDNLNDLRNAAAAELNIVVSPLYGVDAARVFEEVHGTPFVQLDFPIGGHGTRRFLLQVASRLGLQAALVDDLIKREEETYYHFLSRSLDAYNDIDLQRFAIIIGNVNYAYGLTEFAYRELGWLPELVVVNDILIDEQKESVAAGFASLVPELAGKLVFETDNSRMIEHFSRAWSPSNGQRYYRSFSPSFVLGSTLDKELADAVGAGHLPVTYPVSNRQVLTRAYAGYRGGLTLVEDIFSVLLQAR